MSIDEKIQKEIQILNKKTNNDTEYISIEEVAELYARSKSTIQTWRKSKKNWNELNLCSRKFLKKDIARIRVLDPYLSGFNVKVGV
jgi:hypothetical protein